MSGDEGREIPIIKVRGLHKYFGPLHVVKGVDLDVMKGEVVTHRVRVARRVADRVALMDDGVWVEIAPPDVLFDNPKQERTRQFLVKIL